MAVEIDGKRYWAQVQSVGPQGAASGEAGASTSTHPVNVLLSKITVKWKAVQIVFRVIGEARPGSNACADIYRVSEATGSDPTGTPSMAIVLIHGWQVDRFCGFDNGDIVGLFPFSGFEPEEKWLDLIGAIRSNLPRAAIYVVRYPSVFSPRTTGAVLASRLAQLTLPNLVLVGHSMGGLVARYIAQNLPSGAVKAILTIGTPHSGTPAVDLAENGLWTVYPSEGLRSLAEGALPDLQTPAPAPLYVFSGGVRCNAIPAVDFDLTLLPFHTYLCRGHSMISDPTVLGDGIVPTGSSEPPGSITPDPPLGLTTTDHFQVKRHPQVLAGVVSVLRGLVPWTGEGKLVGGFSQTCGLTQVGAAYCWGGNNHAEVGDGTTERRTRPVPVVGGLVFQALSVGSLHTCGLTTGGLAYCWGRNSEGQLGIGTSSGPEVCPTNPVSACSRTPMLVAGDLHFRELTGGAYHTCGLTTLGAAYCWGTNSYGELGDGTDRSRTTPVAVTGGLVFRALSAGYRKTCAVTMSGAAYCWGIGVGDGTANMRTSPVPVAGGLVFQELSVGEYHACGLTALGAAYCWGSNYYGQLGDGTHVSATTPVAVAGGLEFESLSANGFHTCALTTGGAPYCWGRNNMGQLGKGHADSSSANAVAVAGGLILGAITAGRYHSCGLTAGGAAYCWGWNTGGTLGDGTTTNRLSPVAVTGGLIFGAARPRDRLALFLR